MWAHGARQIKRQLHHIERLLQICGGDRANYEPRRLTVYSRVEMQSKALLLEKKDNSHALDEYANYWYPYSQCP